MARHARQSARLDEVWWLVSPQNPLKPRHETAPFEQRLVSARDIAQPYNWIKVLDFEQKKRSSIYSRKSQPIDKEMPKSYSDMDHGCR